MRTANPVYPNAGVEAWYADTLQKIVRTMCQDMLDSVKDAWREGGGIAMDAAPIKHAAGIIFRALDGAVLLLHRTDGTGWAYPGGGVEEGETHRQAAVRECGEEMRWICSQSVQDEEMQWLHIREWRNVRFATFLLDVDTRFTPTLNDEHSAFIWLQPAAALSQLQMHPGARETLVELVGADIATDARPKPTTPQLLQRGMHKWGLKWASRLNEVSDRIAEQFATKAQKATDVAVMKQLSKAGFVVRFKPTKLVKQAYDAVVAENVGLIRSIPQRYLSDVQNVVWQGVMSGSNMADMADQIQQKFGVAHRRAALIARDQNNKAKAAMERARRLDVGITKARWKHSHAGKEPRPSHVAMDGELYDITKGMWDPEVGKFIWPGTEINCKCVDAPVIPGFE